MPASQPDDVECARQPLTREPNLQGAASISGLSFLWLEITGKCNLTCVHCYADTSPHVSLEGAMTFDDWASVITEAAFLGCREIQFIGGEPTLHPRLPDLITLAGERGFEFIEVFTNASRLSDQLIEHFVKYRVHIATSFFGRGASTEQ
jgi:MoaA/NifB/PqqE/SkfB family radical SAM enzyme